MKKSRLLPFIILLMLMQTAWAAPCPATSAVTAGDQVVVTLNKDYCEMGQPGETLFVASNQHNFYCKLQTTAPANTEAPQDAVIWKPGIYTGWQPLVKWWCRAPDKALIKIIVQKAP